MHEIKMLNILSIQILTWEEERLKMKKCCFYNELARFRILQYEVCTYVIASKDCKIFS